ncbi:hypothetical protein CkaCkLH20_08450 [Colletotrichum karsti]|uniref:DRBM domain-containing protein n=1 Tax=Colletotrichum karsti TaxID=1095194 RepID=A0A9P6LHY5_9PEZI|nr:uncharacterized protein CkaCkLH20_08450 [Colletotrichum karsti]KAF9874078.1 hypothetical protein CkaCkLH20_08450 [Colletotrichum karsti]
MAANAPRVDWAALKAWVAEKETYEAQHGHPAPLSEEQATAIAILLRPPTRPEPTLGTQNWIGTLNHFLQVRNQRVIFTDEPRQDPRLGKAPELRWACFVTFDTTGDRFPRPGHGVEDGAPKSPDFTRKQDAKQFAAKCACDWLMDNGQMLPSGELPKFPLAFGSAPPRAVPAPLLAPAPAPAVLHVPAKRAPSSSPPAGVPGDIPVKQEPQPTAPLASVSPKPKQSPSPKQKPAKNPRTSSPLKDSPSPSSSSNPNSLLASANSSTATTPNAGAAIRPLSPSDLPSTKRVEQLANRLNLPIPRYVLREDPTLPGADFWNGTADFDDNPRIPPGLGKVTKAFTKRGAREKMAEEILAWMHTEQDKRSQKSRSVLGS